MQNLKDSTIRGMVDDWYEANVQGKPKETLLEDTVWCSDRSVISEKYTIESYANGTSASFEFAAATRVFGGNSTTEVSLSLVCSRDMDEFTVESEMEIRI